MAEEPKPDQARVAEEKSIADIFSENRAHLAKASSHRKETSIRAAHHRAGFADFITFLLRTGKTTLSVLGLFFGAGGESESGEER